MTEDVPKPLASVIWMRPQRGARGPEPSRDRDTIAATAIRIADAEGIAAVSMRRIAAEIGSGTSSLYRYFARKDDLINLMVDGALTLGALELSGNWRDDLMAIGWATRRTFLTHPWLATALAGRPTLGPNRLAALELMLGVFSDELPATERLIIIDTLTSFVRGFVASELADGAAIRESGLSAELWHAEQAAYAAAIEASGVYPRTTRLFAESRSAGSLQPQEESFAAGLDLILDGVEAKLAVRR
jgi:AcrR family transcriptional regulator